MTTSWTEPYARAARRTTSWSIIAATSLIRDQTCNTRVNSQFSKKWALDSRKFGKRMKRARVCTTPTSTRNSRRKFTRWRSNSRWCSWTRTRMCKNWGQVRIWGRVTNRSECDVTFRPSRGTSRIPTRRKTTASPKGARFRRKWCRTTRPSH